MLVYFALTAWCITMATECAESDGGNVHMEQVAALHSRATQLSAGDQLAKSQASSTECCIFFDDVFEVESRF